MKNFNLYGKITRFSNCYTHYNLRCYLLLFLTFALFIPMSVNAQRDIKKTKEQLRFEHRMDKFIQNYVEDPDVLEEIKNKPHDCHDHGPISPQHILSIAEARGKQSFILSNHEEYRDVYFGKKATTRGSEDTLVCDNGGFEDDFDYYRGYITTYDFGSDSCKAYDSIGVPSTFVETTLPLSNRFQIVTSGTDPVMGINRVKFGSKALRLNRNVGHINGCSGNFGVDRLEKRFLVTDSTRQFTLWYAVALENPSSHNDKQPFLSIECDLDPANSMCFEADVVMCEQYVQSTCPYDSVDILTWTCHRFNIPENEVGNIATLEITMADCGLGGHFGFAYIDGFCEDCSGSALGSATLSDMKYDGSVGIKYCESTDLTVCGAYTLPTLCDETYTLDSITIDGFSIDNLTIDTTKKVFCFELDTTEFLSPLCDELFVNIYFSTSTESLPVQVSNAIEICKEDFAVPNIGVTVGDCNDNDTPIDFSDDYYWVDITVSSTFGLDWEISKLLTDPYPNESGATVLTSGSGDTTITLGPFYILDGDWYLDIEYPNCDDSKLVEAPDYCSGCDEFYEMVIDNVLCDDSGSPTPTDDEWSFDIYVPGSSLDEYSITGDGGISESGLAKGSTHTVNVPSFNVECYDITISIDQAMPRCEVEGVICPPKPCSDATNCKVEAYINTISCDESAGEHYITIDVSGYGPYHCYESTDPSDPNNSSNINNETGSLSLGLNELGPFDATVSIQVYTCDTPSACNTSNCQPADCYKLLYVETPDCSDKSFPSKRLSKGENSLDEFLVYPNPSDNNTIYIQSPIESKFAIYDINGLMIKTFNVKKGLSTLYAPLAPGVYIIVSENRQMKPAKYIRL
ncbi:MAG: T9SS type A sorting domain-containing protein [Bacteroidota bacterium]